MTKKYNKTYQRKTEEQNECAKYKITTFSYRREIVLGEEIELETSEKDLKFMTRKTVTKWPRKLY